MKKLMILLCMLSLLGSGCSTTTDGNTNENIDKNSLKLEEPEKSVIPEPYSLMVDQLKKGNLEMAEKYADLTIRDFPDSPYIYNAYLIKNKIILSKIEVLAIISDYITTGAEKAQGSSLNSPADWDRLESQITNWVEEISGNQIDIKESVQYILLNYSEDGEYQLELTKPPVGMDYLREGDFGNLEWFASIGYPMPQDIDLENSKKLYPKLFYFDYIYDGKINYPEYFYRMGVMLQDKSLAIQVLNKVLEITENDQYNEYRIKAEEFLEILQGQDSK